MNDNKRQDTLKKTTVRTFLLAILLPAVLICIITFVMVYFYKRAEMNAAALTVISVIFPVLVVLICVGIYFYCDYCLLKKQYEKLQYMLDRLSGGRYDHFDYDLDTQEDMLLTDNMNILTDKFAEMNKRVKTSEFSAEKIAGEKQMMGFSLLTAKADPEFLNRMLAAIKFFAETAQGEKMYRAVSDMVDLTSAMSQGATELIDMTDELALVNKYIEINRLCKFIDVDYRISLRGNIVGYKCLPYVVFPIVANLTEFAVRSGIKKYELGVEIFSDRRGLIVSVRDDGRGISDSNFEQIKTELRDNTVDPYRSAISLPNINRRIKLYYGEKYGLTLDKNKVGNVITVAFPPKGEF